MPMSYEPAEPRTPDSLPPDRDDDLPAAPAVST